jgi:hypothetical protein
LKFVGLLRWWQKFKKLERREVCILDYYYYDDFCVWWWVVDRGIDYQQPKKALLHVDEFLLLLHPI